METITISIIIILILASFITAIYIFYRRDKENGLIEKIKKLENQKYQLEQEIQAKFKELEFKLQELDKLDKQINPNSELNFKLDFLIKNISNNNNDNTGILVILIILSTAIIVYFLYQFTYYLQPNNIINSINEALNRFR